MHPWYARFSMRCISAVVPGVLQSFRTDDANSTASNGVNLGGGVDLNQPVRENMQSFLHIYFQSARQSPSESKEKTAISLKKSVLLFSFATLRIRPWIKKRLIIRSAISSEFHFLPLKYPQKHLPRPK